MGQIAAAFSDTWMDSFLDVLHDYVPSQVELGRFPLRSFPSNAEESEDDAISPKKRELSRVSTATTALRLL